MIQFLTDHLWLAVWLAFAFFSYLVGYLDYVYYHDNVQDKLRHAYDALTEEE